MAPMIIFCDLAFGIAYAGIKGEGPPKFQINFFEKKITHIYSSLKNKIFRNNFDQKISTVAMVMSKNGGFWQNMYMPPPQIWRDP